MSCTFITINGLLLTLLFKIHLLWFFKKIILFRVTSLRGENTPIWYRILCLALNQIMKSLSCLFAKLQDDPFKNKALLFSNNAQELHPDPFQAEDPFKSDPFKGADPFKGTSLSPTLSPKGCLFSAPPGCLVTGSTL